MDRHLRGKRNYEGGLAAEEGVARHYQASGRRLRARRWSGRSGEIDLIAEDDDGLVFVEVKSAATHARAAESLSRGQIGRIFRAAEEYLVGEPGGLLTKCRVDLALVDAIGRIDVVENVSPV